MKIISLNTWGGRAGYKELLNFLNEHVEIDIFCLQEMWDVHEDNEHEVSELLRRAIADGVVKEDMRHDLFRSVVNTLPTYRAFFRPHYGSHYGLAMFLKKNLDLREEGDIFVYKEREFVPTADVGNHARNIQYATIETKKGLRTIVNFHGIWNGKGKTDSKDRILQSENVIKFLKTLNHPFVLIGDFNLLPDTESLKKFEQFGLRNLIKEYNITSTRTSLYKKEHRFADYAFVSDGIDVLDFKVLPHEVSDHSPLLVEFE